MSNFYGSFFYINHIQELQTFESNPFLAQHVRLWLVWCVLQAGHHIVVYERNVEVGGLLRYGIPSMKLGKDVCPRPSVCVCLCLYISVSLYLWLFLFFRLSLSLLVCMYVLLTANRSAVVESVTYQQHMLLSTLQAPVLCHQQTFVSVVVIEIPLFFTLPNNVWQTSPIALSFIVLSSSIL